MLTEREKDLLMRFAQGHTNSTVAGDLGISPAMTNNDMLVVRRKLGALNTPHAIYLAMRAGELT